MIFRRRKSLCAVRIDSLVGRNTEVRGDLRFRGGLHVDGTVKGNVLAEDDSGALLTLSEHGTIAGEVRVPNVILNGAVHGNVYARDRLELATRARIDGDVYYSVIEIAEGAAVNGKLVLRPAAPPALQHLPQAAGAGKRAGPE